ncbi:MAG: ATP phosphoribosyltransferase regulatory subunit [Clostridia bacterium]|nr:ATP phosphoribosyltransferase regulatory subunit [Clostridia bacterium]
MSNYNLQTQIPTGVRDILPEEAWRKRLLEDKFYRVFRSWGYQEVLTPTFEYYQAMVTGGDAKQEDNMYKFLDRKGQILSLRPDMTTPIARLVATRLKEVPLPLRLCYLSNVFSHEDPQVGRQREYFQAGVELLGTTGGEADAEVIAVAVEALKASGLQEFQIHIGQIEVFNGLMEELGISQEVKEKIKAAIGNKNFVGVEEYLEGSNLSRERREELVRLITFHGGKEVIEEGYRVAGNNRARAALDNLAEVYDTLESYGVAGNVAINLGVLRGFDYYTGLVFEGYSSALGFPICGGGRYDGLVGQFGYPCPATGFAIGVDRVLLALGKQGDESSQVIDYLIVYEESTKSKALAKARELREQGLVVETEIMGRTAEEIQEYVKMNGIREVLAINNNF